MWVEVVGQPRVDRVGRGVEADLLLGRPGRDEPVQRHLVVGDAVWDVESAGRAGLGCIGVRTGGICDIELREAGALRVFDGPAELADHLGEVVGPQR